MKKICVIFLCLAVLCGCGFREPLTSGVITSKFYSPERDWTQLMPIVHTTVIGKSSVATVTYIPVRRHESERWVIVIQEPTPTGDRYTGRQRTIDVSHEAYDRYEIGQTYAVQSADDHLGGSTGQK